MGKQASTKSVIIWVSECLDLAEDASEKTLYDRLERGLNQTLGARRTLYERQVERYVF